jgi:hypothetical protein
MKNIPPDQIGIKEIYASNFLHTALWSFVTAQRLCNVDVSQSIRNFINFFGVEDLDEGTLRQVFYRKNSEYKKCAPGISSDAKTVFKQDEVDKMLGIVKTVLTNGR